VVEDLRVRCSPAGLDLLQPFQLAWYNCAVDEAFKLPDLGRPSALGVLIGNTRALWRCFRDAVRADPRTIEQDHPLDRYVAAATLGALGQVAHRWEVRWAYEPPPRRVAMQRLAHVSGLAYLSPSHFNVHVVYGPWIALRAAVVIDTDGPAGAPPSPPNPCPDCERDCMPRFRQAAGVAESVPRGHAVIEERWRAWLAVRDACPVGRAHRYGDEQIRYHYTKDQEILKRLVGKSGGA
jgi:methylmalonic aciduria homocystinuria type C protein